MGIKKYQRIKRKNEVKQVFSEGLTKIGNYFTLKLKKNDLNYPRLAIICSRKIGKAVVRNKAKRWMREIFRETMKKLRLNVDIVAILKPQIIEAKFLDVKNEWQALLGKYPNNQH